MPLEIIIRKLQLSNDPADADLLADIDAYRADLSRRLHRSVTLVQAYGQLIVLYALYHDDLDSDYQPALPLLAGGRA